MARGEAADFDIPFEKSLFSRKNAECRKRIRKIIREVNYDAILLNTSLAAFHVRLAAPKKKRPKIVNLVHGYFFSKRGNFIKNTFFLFAERFLRGKTDAIITMNTEDHSLAKRFRLTHGKIYLIRGMGAQVSDVITPPEAIREEFFPRGSFVLAFVGELSKRKNQGFLIDALEIIKKEIPNAVLCLVGDGIEREKLVEKAKALGLSESVVFVGSRTNACDFMRSADLYVSASGSEGMPFNLIEALGLEKTVLASKIKGHTDLILDGVDGFLYEPGNKKDFASKVLKIYCGELAPDKNAIRKKYDKFKRASVFPETYSIIKDAVQ